MASVMTDLKQLQPDDEHNRKLAANVRPPNWTNPVPDGRYNLVVIGGGTAGLVAAAGAAGLGARVALIERERMGGDCLNAGCVPSKALIRTARVARAVRNAGDFGVEVPAGVRVDFAVAMERMRRLRARISPADSAARFRELGVDVYFGNGRFVDAETIEVDRTKIKFKNAVIATGTRPAVPSIPGVDQVDYLTNETVFALTECPSRLGVVGAGPIGCELAQSFALLGSEVVLVEATHGILPREDRAAADIVKETMLRDGVKLLCCAGDFRVAPQPGGGSRLTVVSHGEEHDEIVDQLLVSVGRTPNVDDLNLAAVGVDFDRQGVKVNDRLQTTHPRIFAAGDVCSKYRFTHAADFMARIVIQNALFKWPAKASSLVIPWCTYTSPEIAHVGMNENDAERKGIAIDTYQQAFADIDRAILDGEDTGLVKIHVKQRTDKIVGATIVGTNAGDLIAEITLAMKAKVGLQTIGNTIHPYPTHAEAIRKLGDQCQRARLTPRVKSLFSKWLAWTR